MVNPVSKRSPSVGDPAAIPEFIAVNDRDAERLRAAIGEHYGFTATLAYCGDLIAFVDAMKGKSGK